MKRLWYWVRFAWHSAIPVSETTIKFGHLGEQDESRTRTIRWLSVDERMRRHQRG